jgi:hypothetical protein
MNDPGLPKAMPRPGPRDGGEAVGSGNVARPCRRMHSASFTIANLRLSDPDPLPGPPPGISFEHAFWADWNAGERGLIPELELSWIPPPSLGSGKFGTPCERMQAANLIPASLFELDPCFDFPEDPHAVSAIAQQKVASATARMRRQLPAPVHSVVDMSRGCSMLRGAVVMDAR